MENVLRRLSPQSAPGSMIASILIHGFCFGAVLALMSTRFFRSRPVMLPDAEIGYQMFDEPPSAPIQPRRIVHSVPALKPQPKAALLSSQELHDDHGQVAGAQAASVAQPAAAAGSGSAVPVPYYRIKPKYPRAALVSGDEGWVLLKIDIMETGAVENVRIVDGEKRSLFEEEARRAIEKWKYPPGQKRVDHSVKIEFKLQDA